MKNLNSLSVAHLRIVHVHLKLSLEICRESHPVQAGKDWQAISFVIWCLVTECNFTTIFRFPKAAGYEGYYSREYAAPDPEKWIPVGMENVKRFYQKLKTLALEFYERAQLTIHNNNRRIEGNIDDGLMEMSIFYMGDGLNASFYLHTQKPSE